MFTKILLPVDLAEAELTQRGLEVALELARAGGSDIRIITVLLPAPPFYLDHAPEEFEEDLRQNLEEQIAEMASATTYSPQRVSWSVLSVRSTIRS